MGNYIKNTDLLQDGLHSILRELIGGYVPANSHIEDIDLLEPQPKTAENLNVALSLADRGLAVCPLRQWGDGDGWKPIKDFPKLATTDHAQIRKWWRQWPESRVALITGERNGISVLDVDIKNGKDGLASLAALGIDDYRLLSPVRAITPSGGFHLFFAYKADLKATVGKIGPGLDVRNNGGFVVAPGSIKDGRRYEVDGADLLLGKPLPAWPEALTPPPQPEREPVVVQEASEYHREWAREFIKKRAADVAATAEGGRQAELNNASLWAGGAGAHGALTRDEAAEALIEAGKACGLPEREARDTFNHGWKDGLRKPIELPIDYGNIVDLFVDLPDLDDQPELLGKIKQTKIGLITTKNGDIKPTLHNAILILSKVNRDNGYSLRKNDMTEREEWRAGEIGDADLDMLRVAIEQAGMHNVGADLTAGAVRAVAKLNHYHPVKDWLTALNHDGVARLDTWLTRYLNVDDSQYSRAVGRAFMVAMVARIMQPGCKHDHILILRGTQGIGKSTACRILSGAEYFSETMPAIKGDKTEAYRHLKGKWLIEVAELASTRKSEAEDLKAFYSGQIDTYREPYARKHASVKRQCVFVGTTNEDTFLRDASGGRRFWPVTCGAKIETEALAADRDQLFAEAVAAFRAGEAWHLTPELEEHAAIEQEAARKKTLGNH